LTNKRRTLNLCGFRLRVGRLVENTRGKESKEERKKEEGAEERCDEMDNLGDAFRELGRVANMPGITLDNNSKKDNLSDVESQSEGNGSFDGVAGPDLDVVHVLVSSKGGEGRIGDETQKGRQLNTGARFPYALKDSVCDLSKSIDKEGEGGER